MSREEMQMINKKQKDRKKETEGILNKHRERLNKPDSNVEF